MAETATETHPRLRLAVLRAIGELQMLLSRTVRLIEVYNHKLLRNTSTRIIDGELVSCWKERLVRRDDAGNYDMVAAGREYLQTHASEPANLSKTNDIPQFVPKRRGRPPNNPGKEPEPIRDIPLSETVRTEEVTRQLRNQPEPQPSHIERTLADLRKRADHHQAEADKLRALIADLQNVLGSGS